jgi:hypothetical protein
MARFAPVAPVDILHELYMKGGDSYHLPLAHDVIREPKKYGQLFGTMENEHKYNRVVILDNSVIELGLSVDVNIIKDAAEIVRANVIVLPDVLLDTDKTIRDCRKAVDEWDRIFTDSTLLKYTFMVVPQGTNRMDWARCAEAFAGDSRIGWWGVPRNYNIKGLGSRRDAVEILRAVDPSKCIHLLGFSDDIVDDVLSARHPNVAGIDSAVPSRAASLGLSMSLGLDAKLPPRGDWWNDPSTRYVPLMRDNYRAVQHMVDVHSTTRVANASGLEIARHVVGA